MTHEPVMLREAVESLAVKKGGVYLDATTGSGGHAAALLEAIGPSGRLIGIDRDEEALERTRQRLGDGGGRYTLAKGNYADVAAIVRSYGIERVDGVLVDCGASLEQLTAAERGFSLMQDGPLDMRMDRSLPETAADLVNRLSEDDLCAVLRSLGEERAARRIARAVCRERARSPITTTLRLADLVSRAVGGRCGRTHPATKSFQALRMRTNRELESLEAGLTGALELLNAGGRLVVITFNSLEDRLAKGFFAGHAGRWESLQAGGRAWRGELPPLRLVNRKALKPSEDELRRNPRARSAKLRAAERLAGDEVARVRTGGMARDREARDGAGIGRGG